MVTESIHLPMDAVRELCERYRVRELAIFGSALQGNYGPESDLDLLVEFKPDAEVGFLALARLQRELSELLGVRVDVVPKNGLKPAIRDHVLQEAQVVYAT